MLLNEETKRNQRIVPVQVPTVGQISVWNLFAFESLRLQKKSHGKQYLFYDTKENLIVRIQTWMCGVSFFLLNLTSKLTSQKLNIDFENSRFQKK